MSAVTPAFIRVVRIGVGPEQVFAALTTLEGLAGWWTPLVSGDPAAGGTLVFRFAGLDEHIVMVVDELAPPRRVVWRCGEHTGHPEWHGTEITFALEPGEDGSCVLRLHHAGLLPRMQCYEVCASGWESFMASIARFAETGRGTPFSG